MTRFFIRRTCTRDTREGSHVKPEAVTGTMLPEAEEHLGSSELKEARNDPPPEILEQVRPCNVLVLDF